MSHAIIKLADDAFVEWSTIVDAPIGPVFTKSEARQVFDPIRVQRADANGHSWLNEEPDFEYAKHNRAGEGERQISIKEMIRKYTDPASVQVCINRARTLRSVE